MNRLETGRIKLHVKLHNVTDLVDASLKKVGKELAPATWSWTSRPICRLCRWTSR